MEDCILINIYHFCKRRIKWIVFTVISNTMGLGQGQTKQEASHEKEDYILSKV